MPSYDDYRGLDLYSDPYAFLREGPPSPFRLEAAPSQDYYEPPQVTEEFEAPRGRQAPQAVAEAAERYRNLGPRESRTAAMQEYRDALNAEKWKDRYDPERWNEFLDTKSRYDDWFKRHVAEPYNDPNKIGGATLYTDEKGVRRMDIPSVLEEQRAREKADDKTREYGDLKVALVEARRRDPKTGRMQDPLAALEISKRINELQGQTRVGEGSEKLVAAAMASDPQNQLAQRMEEREALKTVKPKRLTKEKPETKRKEAVREKEEEEEKMARGKAYEAGEGFQSGLSTARNASPAEEIPIEGGYQSALGYPGYPAPAAELPIETRTPATRSAETVPVARERVVPLTGGYESALGYAGRSPFDTGPTFMDLVRAKFRESAEEQERTRDSWLHNRRLLPRGTPAPVNTSQLIGTQYTLPLGYR